MMLVITPIYILDTFRDWSQSESIGLPSTYWISTWPRLKSWILTQLRTFPLPEEMFSSHQGFWWSPGGKHLAYIETNDTEVQIIEYTWYGDEQYPSTVLIPYPKVRQQCMACWNLTLFFLAPCIFACQLTVYAVFRFGWHNLYDIIFIISRALFLCSQVLPTLL